MPHRIAMFEGPPNRPGAVIPLHSMGVAAPIMMSARFLYQSYFDTVQLRDAILSQNPTQSIVDSTRRQEETPGYAVGLLPWSETPVAVKFKKGGASAGESQVFILRPGEVLWPFGQEHDRAFSGFEWGLPFGWLGGGVATLAVLQSPDARVEWGTHRPEIPFHRQRVRVLAAATNPEAQTAWGLWPTIFPSIAAASQAAAPGAVASAQYGRPVLQVEPTRTILRLRVGTLGAPVTIRCFFAGESLFDLSDVGVLAAFNTQLAFEEVTFGTNALVPGAAANVQFPVAELTSGLLVRAGCNEATGGLILASLDAAAQSQYVDIVRYGRL